MRSLARVALEGMSAGVPLPAPYALFHENEAQLYRGEVSVFAGPPGSMKTITALNFVNRIGVPTLYISNDSTQYTVVSRTFSMITGESSRVAEEMIKSQPELVAQVLRRWSKVRFDFRSNPDIERIGMFGEAFRTLYGEYPHLTVVDIAMNIDHDGVGDQNYWKVFPELKDVAGSWNTAMMVIHHTSEGVKGEPCPPRSAIMGKPNQLPALIVTQMGTPTEILYAVVKNRNGGDDASGKTHFSLPVWPGQCRIEDAEIQDDTPFQPGTVATPLGV